MCSLVIRQWRRALLVSECAGRQLQALSMRRHKYTGSCSASSSSSSSSSIKTGAQPLNRWLSGIRSSVGVQSRGRLLSSAASTEAVSLALTDDKLLEQCRILVGKSSGPGGQHVNTTNSAVRIIHNPTGVAAECSTHRCQHRNKALALQLLRRKVALEAHPQPHLQPAAGADHDTGSGTSLGVSPDEAASIQYLFRKNASKKDPLYFEGMRVLLGLLQAHDGALSVSDMVGTTNAKLVKFLGKDKQTLTKVNMWRRAAGFSALPSPGQRKRARRAGRKRQKVQHGAPAAGHTTETQSPGPNRG